MDLIPVILDSHMDKLQRDGILEAKSALAATKLIKLPQKEVRNVGFIYQYLVNWHALGRAKRSWERNQMNRPVSVFLTGQTSIVTAEKVRGKGEIFHGNFG